MIEIVEALGLDPARDVVQWMVLALPGFVLLLLIVSVARVFAKRRARRIKAHLRAPGDALHFFERELRNGDAALSTQPVGTPGAAFEDAATIEILQTRLNDAMTFNSNTALAPIYLELARKYFAAGNEAHYHEALLAAASLAAQHGPKAVHAEVRLELAEVALRMGDATGACEQWQMARVALEEAGEKEAYDLIDRRMRASGCPTDWVLMDF